jgi:translation initiation factor 3 subunit A
VLSICCVSILWEQNHFQQQVVSRREGEFERLKQLREERLAEERAFRSQERDVRRKKEYYKRQEEARLLKIREDEEARKLEEAERKQKEEADRWAKLEEIAQKQRQREIEAEEREKREREALRSKIEDKPGKFIPPSLRKRLESEEPRRSSMESSDNWNDRREARPPVEERRPALFATRTPIPSRESEHGVEAEADSALPPSNKYQPPRSREPEVPHSRPGAYEPPRGVSRDTYAPPRGGGRFGGGGGYSDGPPSRPARPFPGAKVSEDRWGSGGGSGGGFDRERSNRDDARPDIWRRGPSQEAPPRQPEEQAA